MDVWTRVGRRSRAEAAASCAGRVAVAPAPINAGWAVGVTRPEVWWARESRSRSRAHAENPSRRATSAADVSRREPPRVATGSAPGAREAATETPEPEPPRRLVIYYTPCGAHAIPSSHIPCLTSLALSLSLCLA